MIISLQHNMYVHTLFNFIWKYDIEQVVCYGLGPICSAPISQHQLAVLLIVAKDKPVYCFDPVFDRDDLAALAYFNVQLCGYPKYPNPELFTLLYMPHCERQLYVDVVVEDKNIILFGNRLLNYPEFKDYNLVVKKPPNEEYIRQDVFNDCYLHLFGVED